MDVGGEKVLVEAVAPGPNTLSEYTLKLTDVVPPRAAGEFPEAHPDVYLRMWELKYGNHWVQDKGFGEYCISDSFYMAAATHLHRAGLAERKWIAGTDRYAYRLLDGNR